uniref:Uncharacterized protein n=1 Tax=Anguilla anguilla TaxID=7936 RepID=A0A0E9W199_ANGAN
MVVWCSRKANSALRLTGAYVYALPVASQHSIVCLSASPICDTYILTEAS